MEYFCLRDLDTLKLISAGNDKEVVLSDTLTSDQQVWYLEDQYIVNKAQKYVLTLRLQDYTVWLQPRTPKDDFWKRKTHCQFWETQVHGGIITIRFKHLSGLNGAITVKKGKVCVDMGSGRFERIAMDDIILQGLSDRRQHQVVVQQNAYVGTSSNSTHYNTASSMTQNDKIRIKCFLGEDIRIVSVLKTITYEELLQKLEDEFGFPVQVTQYEDHKGDRVGITSNFDFQEAFSEFEELRAINPTKIVTLKLFLEPSNPSAYMHPIDAPPLHPFTNSHKLTPQSTIASSDSLLGTKNGDGTPYVSSPITPITSQSNDENIMHIFTHLANRVGYSEMNTEIKSLMNKVVQFYAPLVSQYGQNIMEMDPTRLMTVSQMINESVSPIIVAGNFFMITCNSPAHELTGLRKSDIGRGTSSDWKYIFDLIHKDDAVTFVKRSVECLTSFTDLDRIKVRLTVPAGFLECIVSETIHRNSNGVPLFSSFTFVRIDDYLPTATNEDTFKPVPNASKNSSSPQVINPTSWQKGKLLGSGGFGKVYMGLLSSGDVIAVKKMKLRKKGEVTNYTKEIELMRSLHHNNIVCYLGCEVIEKTLNIFLEYMSGGSISELLENLGPFKEATIQSYTRHILRGLEYLHSQNIIHRDIKGANILVDKGIAKLADFGCSKLIEDSKGGTTLLGTPCFMSPEVIKGLGYGKPADIWSLGCVLIEMASGKPPFSHVIGGPSAIMWYIASSDEPPEIPDHLSPNAKDFVLLCFKRDTKERPTAEALLEHQFLL